MKFTVASLALAALSVATFTTGGRGVLAHDHHHDHDHHGHDHHHHEGGIRSLAGQGQVQGGGRTCKVMDVLERLKKKDAKLEEKMARIEEHTQKKIKEWKELRGDKGKSPKNRALLQVEDVITIPVVVHILYNNANENIVEAQIQSQIDVLNKDFRRRNSDADGTWGSAAADTKIEFCLASTDPNGNPTNGITRTSTSVSSFGTNDSIKFASSGGKDAWPAGEYLNMWVGNIGGGILGYAQFPGGSASTDGVVMAPQYFGSSDDGSFYLSAPFDLGRTTTHEVGHWLNLRHIWGDGNCNADDFIPDTPSSDAANYGCATGHSSCQTTDMVQNYMDYSDDACMNLFSQGQTERMRTLFSTGGFRESLLSSGATKCGATIAPTVSPRPTSAPVPTEQPTSIAECNDASVSVRFEMDLLTDNYPEETSWEVKNSNGIVVASGSGYSTKGTEFSEGACLEKDTSFTFTIKDSIGDGICCGYGSGSCVAKFNDEPCGTPFGNFGSTASCTWTAAGTPTTTGTPPTCVVAGEQTSPGRCNSAECCSKDCSGGKPSRRICL